MKIGILTFHNAMNYGAVLQCMALQKKIRSMAKDCDIINYECKKFRKIYSVFYRGSGGIKGIISMLIYLPVRIIKYGKFNTFRKKYLLLSSKKYTMHNRKEIKDDFDAIIVGSDQVWNPIQTDRDLTYLLDFVSDDNVICASYAASLGMTSLTETDKKIFLQELKKFKYISVREKSSLDILKSCTEKHIELVCDPVFLISRDEWINQFNFKQKKNSEYVFTYCLHEQSMYEYSKEICCRYKLKNIVAPDSIFAKTGGKKICTMGIRDLLMLIYNAECIVTDSFHVLALSLILHKRVKVVLKKTYKELNGRLIDLIKRFGLNNIIVENADIPQIDFNIVDEAIEKYVAESEWYLKKIIKG